MRTKEFLLCGRHGYLIKSTLNACYFIGTTFIVLVYEIITFSAVSNIFLKIVISAREKIE